MCVSRSHCYQAEHDLGVFYRGCFCAGCSCYFWAFRRLAVHSLRFHLCFSSSDRDFPAPAWCAVQSSSCDSHSTTRHPCHLLLSRVGEAQRGGVVCWPPPLGGCVDSSLVRRWTPALWSRESGEFRHQNLSRITSFSSYISTFLGLFWL